jgi:hypothetical protein
VSHGKGGGGGGAGQVHASDAAVMSESFGDICSLQRAKQHLMERVEGLQAIVAPAAVPFQNVTLRCHKKNISVNRLSHSNDSPISHVQNGVGMILSVYRLPLSQAFF